MGGRIISKGLQQRIAMKKMSSIPVGFKFVVFVEPFSNPEEFLCTYHSGVMYKFDRGVLEVCVGTATHYYYKPVSWKVLNAETTN